MNIHRAFKVRSIKVIFTLFILVSIALLCYFYKYYKHQSESYFKTLPRLRQTHFYIKMYIKNSDENDVEEFYNNLKKLENENKVIDIDLVYFSSILNSINKKIKLKYIPAVEEVFLDGYEEKLLLAIPGNKELNFNKKAFFKDINLFIWSKGKNKVNNLGFGDDINLNYSIEE